MIVINKAKLEDVDQICQLYYEYFKEIENCFPKRHLKLLQKLFPKNNDKSGYKGGVIESISDKNQLLLVAKEGKTVIGCVVGYIEGPKGKFDQLILSKQSDDKDVLRKLYSELENWFKLKKCHYVEVDVVFGNPRKKLYEEFGFDTVIEEMRKIVK